MTGEDLTRGLSSGPAFCALAVAAVLSCTVPGAAQEAEGTAQSTADSTADAEAAAEIDPAIHLMFEAAAFLAGQERLAVDWFITYDEVHQGREKITYVRSGSHLLERGKRLSVRWEDGTKIRGFHYDGETAAFHAADIASYVSGPYSGTVDALVELAHEDYGLTIPVMELFADDLPEAAMAEVEAAAYLGETLVAGRPAHHLAFAGPDEDWQIWIAAEGDPVILMLVGTDPYQQGWPSWRAHFYHWDFAPDLSGGAFAFVPGEGEVRLDVAKLPRPVEDDASAEPDESE